MKRLVLLICVVCFLGLACETASYRKNLGPPSHAKAYGVKKKQEFYYYPGVEIYFNPVTRVYIVWKSGSWITLRTSPVRVLGSYVVIHDNTGKPWKKHAHYKKTHQKKHYKKAQKNKGKKHKNKGKGKGKGKKKGW